MEQQPTQGIMEFDPPDNVIAPAFSELLARLNRARTSKPMNPNITQEEKIIFTYGVSQRRRVLEHAILLIFGQWLTYKQVISRLTQSRPLRSTYTFFSIISTSAFLRYRATQVSKDLFAHIATQDTSSALANEARIILAEMEGPQGPYFKSVCEAKGFQQLLDDDNQFTDNSTNDGQHPQLNLQPRLLTKEVIAQSMSNHPQIAPRDQSSSAENLHGKLDFDSQLNKNSKHPTIRMRSNMNSNSPTANNYDADKDSDTNDNDYTSQSSISTLPSYSISTSSRSGKQNDSLQSIDNSDTSNYNEEWGKAFDFSNSKSTSDSNESFGMLGDPNQNSESNNDTLTPSQKRATERRKMRLAARARNTGSSQQDDSTY